VAPNQEGFHLPGGLVLAVLGFAFALVLVSHMGVAELITLGSRQSFRSWIGCRARAYAPSLIYWICLRLKVSPQHHKTLRCKTESSSEMAKLLNGRRT